jgi:hypothetical protein
MDKGYDNSPVHAECEEHRLDPVIPLRGVTGKQPVLPIGIGGRSFPRTPRHSQRFREPYRSRAAVEREFRLLPSRQVHPRVLDPRVAHYRDHPRQETKSQGTQLREEPRKAKRAAASNPGVLRGSS